MSMQDDPSFDDFFNKQAHSRQSSNDQSSNRQGSGSNSVSYDQSGPSSYLTQTGRPMMEEPHSLIKQESMSSLRQKPGKSSRMALDRVRRTSGTTTSSSSGGSGDWRKESLPFDPESSSTLISTAQAAQGQSPSMNGYNGSHQGQAIGDIMFPSQTPPAHHSPFAQNHAQNQYNQNQWDSNHIPHQQYPSHPSPFSISTGTPMTDGPDNPATSSTYYYDQSSPYQQQAFYQQQDTSAEGQWGAEFVEQSNGQSSAQDYNWNNGNQNEPGPMDEDLLNELERIITNSQAGSRHPSRSGSPFQQNPGPSEYQQDYTQQFDNSLQHEFVNSNMTSRSDSPLPQQSFTPAPSFQMPAISNPSSPFFRKPQSPPALVIPNQPSPAPALPPIITTAMSQDNAGGGHHRSSSFGQGNGGGTSGGLFPPVNPALEGLTGMAGISPIGPNADGPRIYIQPSTPISGLKDGRGVFDFRQATTAQAGSRLNQGGAPQNGQAGQVSGSIALPRRTSAEGVAEGQSGQGINQQGSRDQNFGANQQAGQPAWNDWTGLRPGHMRPRAKSDSQAVNVIPGGFDRAAFLRALGAAGQANGSVQDNGGAGMNEAQLRGAIDAWRAASMVAASGNPSIGDNTVDPRALPGRDDSAEGGYSMDALKQFNQLSAQLNSLHAQRRLPPLNTGPSLSQSGVLKYEPGEISPTSLAFYHQLGITPPSASQLAGTSSAPFSQSTFDQLNQSDLSQLPAWPQTAGPAMQSFLMAGDPNSGMRRRSIAEGMPNSHPAAGAGTPGYGIEFQKPAGLSPFGSLNPNLGVGPMRSGSPGGHRRAARSEDLGRSGSQGAFGTGWGVGVGGSTSDFLSSITANDGTLLPPTRGRSSSHSRHSSVSSVRSASPALSISSQGSFSSHHSPRMAMPDSGVQVPQLYNETTAPAVGKGKGGKVKKVAKMKVTSVATEVASSSRRTNDGTFVCPIPGCGSTFTRHFNLKGHLRSHNDERPYKCLYDGCPKSVVGFARQHDCKRHMLLHEGLRPFECEGCGKKFARLDALTRHHKSEQGQECAISHPLPTNPDGTPMSESQYKAYKAGQADGLVPGLSMAGESSHQFITAFDQGGEVKSEFSPYDQGGTVKRERNSFGSHLSADDRSGDEYEGGGGMSDYDRA